MHNYLECTKTYSHREHRRDSTVNTFSYLLQQLILLYTSECEIVCHTLVACFSLWTERNHVIALRVELMNHVALMTHHDHHACEALGLTMICSHILKWTFQWSALKQLLSLADVLSNHSEGGIDSMVTDVSSDCLDWEGGWNKHVIIVCSLKFS